MPTLFDNEDKTTCTKQVKDNETQQNPKIMSPYIYLRALKHADYSVFCVSDGQKTYYDPQFERQCPFSSGQQVKRSIITSVAEQLGVACSPVTFVSNVARNGALGEGEAYSVCDPTYVDQLLGGWMQARAGGENRTIKRRSPLSISAMRPIHPLLAGVPKENMTFDRSDKPEQHRIIVKDAQGNELTEEQVTNLLKGSDRSLMCKWIADNKRATGLFVYDVAIDLRTLFCVSTNQFEPELSAETIANLRANGWVDGKNVFGSCLIAPKDERERIIPALAHALLNWRITSNQARTFSLLETLAVAISDNANKVPAAIRAKLTEEGKARPIVDETAGADVFVTLPCANYIVTEAESAEALDLAEKTLVDRMKAFDYENQI